MLQVRRRSSAVDTSAGHQGQADRFVLPRHLRKPARLAGRWLRGDVEPPRHAMLVLTLGFFTLTGVYGAALGGHLPGLMRDVTTHSGFAVSEIEISGNSQTSDIDVVGALGLSGWTSMVGFSALEARDQLASLPWVQDATVRKIYPATLKVDLTERQPFALWQRGEDLFVIERDGSVIAPYASDHFANLPLVVGPGAGEKASLFIAAMARYPEIASRVKGYVRVAGRRWDLHLDNGVTVKLPEKGELGAVERLITLDREQALLDRDIQSVDMRFEGRLVLQVPEAVAKARAEAVKAARKGKGRRGA